MPVSIDKVIERLLTFAGKDKKEDRLRNPAFTTNEIIAIANEFKRLKNESSSEVS